MAQATNTLLDLERALRLVKAAGYRVTKPKPRKLCVYRKLKHAHSDDEARRGSYMT
jgi:hypothetical protein